MTVLQRLASRFANSDPAHSPSRTTVLIRTTTGRSVLSSHDIRHHRDDPDVEHGVIARKFHALVNVTVGVERADQVVALLRDLDTLPTVAPLTRAAEGRALQRAHG